MSRPKYYYKETYEVVEDLYPPRVSRYTTASTSRRDDRYSNDRGSNALDDRIRSSVRHVTRPLDDGTETGYRDSQAPRQGRSSNARDQDRIRSGVRHVTRPPTNLPPSDLRANAPPPADYSRSYAQAPPTQAPYGNDFASNKGYAAPQQRRYTDESKPNRYSERDNYSARDYNDRDNYSPRGGYSDRDNYSPRGGYSDRDNYSPRGGYSDRDKHRTRDYRESPPRRQSSTIPPRGTGSGSNRRAEEQRLRQEEEIRKEEERIRREDRRRDKEKRQWFFEQIGCSERDSIEIIKKAHRKAQIKMHPDKHPNETEKYNDMFAKLNEEFDKIEKKAARDAART